MNNKAIWAALATVFFVTGLQSQELFPEKLHLTIKISLILFGGICVWRLISLEEKKRKTYEDWMISIGQKNKEELSIFRISMEEALEKAENSGRERHQEMVGTLQKTEENIKKMEESVLRSVKDSGSYAVEHLKMHLTEAASRFEEAVCMQQHDVAISVQDILKNIEERNRGFEEIVGSSLKFSEKQFKEGHDGIRTAIESFAEKVSEFSVNTEEVLFVHSERLDNFISDFEDELEIFIRDLKKVMGDTMADLCTRNEEVLEEMRLLGNEYRRFEELSQGMLNKMVSISEEDYVLMKDVFKDECL